MNKNMNKKLKFSTFSLAAVLLLASCNGTAQQADEKTANQDSTEQTGDFVPMFDANSLSGWEGDSLIWNMHDGVLTGEIKADAEPLKNNTFLIWKGGEVGDFTLKSQFRISADGNSGINYRSERLSDPVFALKGYQADIDGKHNYTGQNYEERKRTTLAYRGQRTEIPNPTAENKGESSGNAWSSLIVTDTVATDSELSAAIKADDWNDIEIVAQGNKLSHFINGQLISEVIDNDLENRMEKGFIGVQVHVGPPMKIEYKDMQIKILK